MMKQRMEQMALRTWEAIGADTLTCLEEGGYKAIMKKENVIEMICDSGYMKMYGQDKEAYEHWNKLPDWKAKMNAVKDAFPFETYGW
jgi:hypothetical protein